MQQGQQDLQESLGHHSSGLATCLMIRQEVMLYAFIIISQNSFCQLALAISFLPEVE